MSQAELIHITTEASEKTISFSSDHLNDIHTGPRIAQHLNELILRERYGRKQGACRLRLDFGNIERLGTAGLNELIGVNRQARSIGVRLLLVDVQDAVRDVFIVTRLERMFEFDSSTVHA